MENLDRALPVMLNGLLVVFVVMSLIALLTWGMGQIFIRLDAKDAERKKAGQANADEEKARKQAEKLRKKAEREKAKAEKTEADEADEAAPKGDETP
jgi:Na+-transporting methylmalonyl-CoA/oxaloacetate decarboxylase gamma subunit